MGHKPLEQDSLEALVAGEQRFAAPAQPVHALLRDAQQGLRATGAGERLEILDVAGADHLRAGDLRASSAIALWRGWSEAGIGGYPSTPEGTGQLTP